MSRIAKKPVAVPAGVEIKIDADALSAKGPKGELRFALNPQVKLSHADGELRVQAANDDKRARALSGTVRAMLSNIITGVASGFEKHLEIVGVGYRARAQGKQINLNLGYSHAIQYQLPDGVSAETPTQTNIVLRAADKQLLGQVAAEIRALRRPEPYKGKGVRYADEHVIRKQAKKK